MRVNKYDTAYKNMLEKLASRLYEDDQQSMSEKLQAGNVTYIAVRWDCVEAKEKSLYYMRASTYAIIVATAFIP